MGISQRTEKSIVKASCGVQLKDRKTSMDSLLMMGLNEGIDQLAMATVFIGMVMCREETVVMS